LSEEYRSWSSSLWSLLHSPVISSLLGPNIHHPQPTFLPQCQRLSCTPIQQGQNYSSIYLDP
jgi:hypothetical protein